MRITTESVDENPPNQVDMEKIDRLEPDCCPTSIHSLRLMSYKMSSTRANDDDFQEHLQCMQGFFASKSLVNCSIISLVSFGVYYRPSNVNTTVFSHELFFFRAVVLPVVLPYPPFGSRSFTRYELHIFSNSIQWPSSPFEMHARIVGVNYRW